MKPLPLEKSLTTVNQSGAWYIKHISSEGDLIGSTFHLIKPKHCINKTKESIHQWKKRIGKAGQGFQRTLDRLR